MNAFLKTFCSKIYEKIDNSKTAFPFFIKFINLVTIDEASLKQLGQAAATIARAEGFEAHARAVEKRLKLS